MKIGLFFGSFNPIHIGHLIIANYMLNNTNCDKVHLVLSPLNPLKKHATDLASIYDRLAMARLATKTAKNIEVSTIEMQLPQPSYTIDTLNHLKQIHDENAFCLIMGSDSLISLPKWKHHLLILRDYKIYVYQRYHYRLTKWRGHPSITITNGPLIEVSASYIRTLLAQGKSVQYLVPDPVFMFINKNKVYH